MINISKFDTITPEMDKEILSFENISFEDVQQFIKKSIIRLISIPKKIKSENIISNIDNDPILSSFTKQSLIEYSIGSTDIIVDLNLSFFDVLVAVWNRISINENSIEIKNVLNQEMLDSDCKCFTGRISRLVNCLTCYDDLVSVTISDNEQIGNIITLVGNRLKTQGNYTIESHKTIVKDELKALGYENSVIEPWILFIE